MNKQMSHIEDIPSVKDPVVKTTAGCVRGINRNGIALFRGIPYGEACEGSARFLPPMPVKEWNGILDCRHPGPIAMQKGTAGQVIPDYFSEGRIEDYGVERASIKNAVLNVGGDLETKTPQQNIVVKSENCLTVNILTPGLDHKKRSVLVYIHGGGFSTGSGTLTFGVDRFAKENDIVVCSLHHRLNVFGFLYLGEFDSLYKSSGLVGMLDLILGLRWIHENIESFGGDPEKVTIMGESGGAMKICTLLNMPETRGLFRHAIIESGSAKCGEYSRESATELTRKILGALGIQDDWKKLLTIPAEELLAAASPYADLFRPVPDDIHLRGHASMYAYEDSAKEIPIIVGSSEDELAGFGMVDQFPVTSENLLEMLSGALKLINNKLYSKEEIEQIISVFAAHSNPDPEQLFWFIVSYAGFLGHGAYCHAVERAQQGGAPVYSYLNAFDAPQIFDQSKRFSWHVSDLPLQLNVVANAESKGVAQIWSEAWAAFIKTGNPSTNKLLWPPYGIKSKKILLVDKESKIIDDFRPELHRVLKI